jgi:hypothetical protein
MKIHINYAKGKYLNSQQHCCATALQNGFDLSKPYGFDDLDSNFVEKNSYIFSQPRGVGYWLWKPYLILKTMEVMKDSDWLMYTDSGMYFVRNPWDWILSCENEIGEKGIATFSICGKNKQFTKRDAFVLMGLDEPRYTDSDQRMASVFVCRKTPFSLSFVEEWLNYAQDPRIISDLPNTQKLPNYPEFKDHRHDQSIMSLLCIKHDTFLFTEDITQFTNPNPYLIHTRNPN